MAPINTPKEKPKVKTYVLNKKIKVPKIKKFHFDMIKTRPTELNGKLVIDDCLKEIHENFN